MKIRGGIRPHLQIVPISSDTANIVIPSKWSPTALLNGPALPCVMAGLVVVAAATTLPLRYRSAESEVERCALDPGVRLSLETLERCAREGEADHEILAQLGDRYAETEQLARAEQVYRRVIAIDPGYADVRLRLGRLLLHSGSRREAAEQARAALLVQPNRGALLALLRDAESDE